MVTLYDPEVHRDAPICSVCIANYNGESLLSTCLDSVFRQNLDGLIEVIVHDDASTDGSVALLRSKYPGIRLIVSDTNVGFCISNNRMADVASGQFLLLLNNDAALHGDALSTLYNRAVTQGFHGILTLPQYDMDSGSLLDMGSRFDPFFNPVPNLNPNRQKVAMVMGACLWCPKNVWNEIGGFPDWFETLAEDMYLCVAAWNRGVEVRVEPSSGYDHAVGRSLGGGKLVDKVLKTTYRRRALSERNKSYVMIIFLPTLLLLSILPLHILALVLEGLLLSLLKLDPRPWKKIYWPALRSLWLSRMILATARTEAQAKRRINSRQLLSLFTPIPYKLQMLLRHGVPRLT